MIDLARPRYGAESISLGNFPNVGWGASDKPTFGWLLGGLNTEMSSWDHEIREIPACRDDQASPSR